MSASPGRCATSDQRQYYTFTSKTGNCQPLYGCYSYSDRNVFLSMEGCNGACAYDSALTINAGTTVMTGTGNGGFSGNTGGVVNVGMTTVGNVVDMQTTSGGSSWNSGMTTIPTMVIDNNQFGGSFRGGGINSLTDIPSVNIEPGVKITRGKASVRVMIYLSLCMS